MAGSPVKRVLGSVLFTLALIVFLGFIFLLFAESRRLTDIPGAEQVDQIAPVAALILGVIAVLLVILLVVRGLERRAERAALAEAYYIPEADREAMRAEKRGRFDEAFALGPGPVPSPPDVKVYHIPALAVASKAWDEPEPNPMGRDHPFHFPRSASGGLYVNDYVEIDRRGNRLKLRTLLAGLEDHTEAGSEAALRFDEQEREEREAALRPPEPEDDGEEPEEEVAEEPEEAGGTPPRPPASSRAAPGVVGGRTDELPGDAFMRELEARSREPREPEAAPDENNVYFDFPGDTRFIEEVVGIGPDHVNRLRAAGVHTTARLCFEDPVELSFRIDAPTKAVRRWQATAELMKIDGIGPKYAEALVAGGVAGIQGLKDADLQEAADGVNAHLGGGRITPRRVAGWQEKASRMRRVRMQVPAE